MSSPEQMVAAARAVSFSDGLELNTMTARLYGQIGKDRFFVQTWSGAGRGSTDSNVWEKALKSYDPTKRFQAKSKGKRGGPLPPGRYRIHVPEWKDNKHPTLGPWVSFIEPLPEQLERFPTRTFDKTTGFFIHGTGKSGSDGCLVIRPTERKKLLSAIEKNGGAYLNVIDLIEGYEL